MIIQSEQARDHSAHCDDCLEGLATHAIVAQGATGRWCEVAWLCLACAWQHVRVSSDILTTEAAREHCNRHGHADF